MSLPDMPGQHGESLVRIWRERFEVVYSEDEAIKDIITDLTTYLDEFKEIKTCNQN